MCNRLRKLGAHFTEQFVKKIKLLLHDIHYKLSLNLWHTLNNARRLFFWFQRAEWLKKILTALFVILISVVFAKITTDFYFTHLNQTPISAGNLAGYLTTIGAMIGGMLAIVFTLSIFAVQNAADLYSSHFFEAYAHNTAEKIRYFFIALITIIFFSVGLFFYSNSSSLEVIIKNCLYFYLFNLTLIALIGSVFVLVYWQYKDVLRKVNPNKALIFLQEKALKFLTLVHKDALRIAKVLKVKDVKVSDNLAVAAAYKNFLQPHLTHLDDQIGKIIEISLRLAEKNEIAASKTGFLAAGSIIVKYLLLRKDSSLAFMSNVSFMAFESDSEQFLVKTLERLNKAGENFIKKHQIENALQIVEIYRLLVTASQVIKFQMRGPVENPVFDIIRGYLKSYQDYAIREKEMDVIFELTKLQHTLVSIAIRNNLTVALSQIQNAVMELAQYGIVDKKLFITDECIKVLLSIIRFIFNTKYTRPDVPIRQTLNCIQSLSVTVTLAIENGYLPNEFTNSTTATKGYDDLMILLSEIMVLYGKQEKEEDKNYIEGVFAELLEAIYESLRALTKQIKKCDTILINSIGRLISEANSLIVFLLRNEDFKSLHADLEHTLIGFIFLPSWFVYESKSIDNNFNFITLIDSPAKTALMLLERGLDDKLVVKCIASIFSSVKEAFTKIKSGYGNDEPRIMLKLCYIGVLALKLKKDKILTEVGVAIYEFEDLYINKYFSQPDELRDRALNREKLFYDYIKWGHDFIHEKYNGRSFMDDSEAVVAPLIEVDDIDRFMYEIWGSFPAHSPIEAEIEQALELKAKKNQYSKLIRILKIIEHQKK